jgi:hypothetical protein
MTSVVRSNILDCILRAWIISQKVHSFFPNIRAKTLREPQTPNENDRQILEKRSMHIAMQKTQPWGHIASFLWHLPLAIEVWIGQ